MDAREIMHGTTAIGNIGAAFYFVPETLDVGKAHGLGGFRFYALGRGGVLGDVDADVVRAAFGYFEPSLMRKLWTTGVATMAPRDAARLYIGCAHEFGRRHLGEVAGLDGFVDAAATVIAAVEGASLPLFAGVRAEPVPDDLAAAAYHQAMVLREMRGSVHLLALTATGLSTRVAHAIRRPNDIAMFGYNELREITDEDRDRWQRAEALTDDVLAPAYATLSDNQAQALVDGTAAIAAAISPVSWLRQ